MESYQSQGRRSQQIIRWGKKLSSKVTRGIWEKHVGTNRIQKSSNQTRIKEERLGLEENGQTDKLQTKKVDKRLIENDNWGVDRKVIAL